MKSTKYSEITCWEQLEMFTYIHSVNKCLLIACLWPDLHQELIGLQTLMRYILTLRNILRKDIRNSTAELSDITVEEFLKRKSITDKRTVYST